MAVLVLLLACAAAASGTAPRPLSQCLEAADSLLVTGGGISTDQLCAQFLEWQQADPSHRLDPALGSFGTQLATFGQSLVQVQAQQRANPRAIFRLNRFALWPASVLFRPKQVPAPSMDGSRAPAGWSGEALPPKSYKNVTTPIKNQGNCGSCWAHAAVEQVETYAHMKAGPTGPPLVPLSVQQLVSCDLANGDQNCNGGHVSGGLKYAGKSGLMKEADYPYTSGGMSCGFFGVMGSHSFCVQGSDRCLSVPNHCPASAGESSSVGLESSSCVDGQCSLDHYGCCLTELEQDSSSENQILNASGWQAEDNTGKMCHYDAGKAAKMNSGASSVHPGADNMLYHLATVGPLGISLAAQSLTFYHSGVISHCGIIHAPTGVDHDVQLIGYNVQENYWQIRNSWGTWWGEDGYFRLERGVNLCNSENYTSSWFPN